MVQIAENSLGRDWLVVWRDRPVSGQPGGMKFSGVHEKFEITSNGAIELLLKTAGIEASYIEIIAVMENHYAPGD